MSKQHWSLFFNHVRSSGETQFSKWKDLVRKSPLTFFSKFFTFITIYAGQTKESFLQQSVYGWNIPRTILIENAIFKSNEFSFDSSSTLNKLFLNSCKQILYLSAFPKTTLQKQRNSLWINHLNKYCLEFSLRKLDIISHLKPIVFQILNLCPFNLFVRSCSDAQKYVAKVELRKLKKPFQNNNNDKNNSIVSKKDS